CSPDMAITPATMLPGLGFACCLKASGVQLEGNFPVSLTVAEKLPLCRGLAGLSIGSDDFDIPLAVHVDALAVVDVDDQNIPTLRCDVSIGNVFAGGFMVGVVVPSFFEAPASSLIDSLTVLFELEFEASGLFLVLVFDVAMHSNLLDILCTGH